MHHSGLPRLAPTVGYQNKGFENSGYNIAATTFIPVGMDKDAMTLADVTPSGTWEDSSISFMTAGGATAKVNFKGSQVAAKYVYWPADWEPEDGAGWYLYADDDAEVNQNATSLAFGSGFLVQRSESGATLTFAGEVSNEPTTISFSNSGYNICGNCSPVDLTLGDITPAGAWEDSSISFMTAGGATAKVNFKGSQVAAKYVYWPADWEPEDGAGWYLYADDDATVNQNAVVISAGEGFLVQRAEAGAMLTIPSAL